MLRRVRLDVPTLLSMIYAPLQPLVQRLHLRRAGSRRFATGDVLVPDGYRVDVVATGLTAPVHACFGPSGEMVVASNETAYRFE